MYIYICRERERQYTHVYDTDHGIVQEPALGRSAWSRSREADITDGS